MSSPCFVHTHYGYCHYAVEEGRSYIYGLFVEPEHRRQGNARYLLTLALAEIRRTGYEGDVEIVAEPQDDSAPRETLVRLYISLGLVVCY